MQISRALSNNHFTQCNNLLPFLKLNTSKVRITMAPNLSITVKIGVTVLSMLQVMYEMQNGRAGTGQHFALFAVDIAAYNQKPLHQLLRTSPGESFLVPIG